MKKILLLVLLFFISTSYSQTTVEEREEYMKRLRDEAIREQLSPKPPPPVDPKSSEFYSLLRESLRKNIIFDSSKLETNITTVVQVYFNDEGLITKMVLIKSSGNTILDNSVLKGFETLKKLPSLPDGTSPSKLIPLKTIVIHYKPFN